MAIMISQLGRCIVICQHIFPLGAVMSLWTKLYKMPIVEHVHGSLLFYAGQCNDAFFKFSESKLITFILDSPVGLRTSGVLCKSGKYVLADVVVNASGCKPNSHPVFLQDLKLGELCRKYLHLPQAFHTVTKEWRILNRIWGTCGISSATFETTRVSSKTFSGHLLFFRLLVSHFQVGSKTFINRIMGRLTWGYQSQRWLTILCKMKAADYRHRLWQGVQLCIHGTQWTHWNSERLCICICPAWAKTAAWSCISCYQVSPKRSWGGAVFYPSISKVCIVHDVHY